MRMKRKLFSTLVLCFHRVLLICPVPTTVDNICKTLIKAQWDVFVQLSDPEKNKYISKCDFQFLNYTANVC